MRQRRRDGSALNEGALQQTVIELSRVGVNDRDYRDVLWAKWHGQAMFGAGTGDESATWCDLLPGEIELSHTRNPLGGRRKGTAAQIGTVRVGRGMSIAGGQ